MPYWRYGINKTKAVPPNISQQLDSLKFKLIQKLFIEYLKNGLQEPGPELESTKDGKLKVRYQIYSRTFVANEDKEPINYENLDGSLFHLEQYYFMKILLMTTGLAATTLAAASYAIRAAGGSQRKTKLY